MSAYVDLMSFLIEGEVVEALVFGGWEGWRDVDFIPEDKIGVVLTLDEAVPLLDSGWEFENNDYGSFEVYSCVVWTNKRIIFVVKYDGRTWLDSVPRNPISFKPIAFGGY